MKKAKKKKKRHFRKIFATKILESKKGKKKNTAAGKAFILEGFVWEQICLNENPSFIWRKHTQSTGDFY